MRLHILVLGAITGFFVLASASHSFSGPASVAFIDSMAHFKGDSSHDQVVVLESFNTPTSALPDDGGGGVFVLNDSAIACPHDDGVVVFTSGGDCYYRQFNGPVHLAWYGVKDAAADTGATSCWKTLSQMDGCDATDAVNRAFAAAAQSAGLGGDGGVVTDGRSIVISSDNLHIPANGYFSCAAPPGGQRNQNGTSNDVPYYLLPNSIVLGARNLVFPEQSYGLAGCE